MQCMCGERLRAGFWCTWLGHSISILIQHRLKQGAPAISGPGCFQPILLQCTAHTQGKRKTVNQWWYRCNYHPNQFAHGHPKRRAAKPWNYRLLCQRQQIRLVPPKGSFKLLVQVFRTTKYRSIHHLQQLSIRRPRGGSWVETHLCSLYTHPASSSVEFG